MPSSSAGRTFHRMHTHAFIDGQNLHLGVLRQGWRLNYRRFRVYLRDKYRVERAFYCIGYLREHERLYSNLRADGYELIFKPVLRGPSMTKGNVDAELVLHATLAIPNCDAIVLVTGDGDFHCLAEHLESIGKLGGIFVPDMRFFSSLLKRFQKHIVYINMLREKLQDT